MNARALLLAALWPVALEAQGFAGLGTQVEGFAIPSPEYTFRFPEDHGAHPDYRIEWWYLTANLEAEDGTPYGLQWTLFRSALEPEGAQLWMGHAAVTTPQAHHVAERLGRGGTGQAGVVAKPFEAWIDEWRMAGDWSELTLTAQGAEFAYDMALTAQGPLVFHGAEGFSVKSAAGQASYYYSQPFFDIEGTLILPEGEVAVRGEAWLDREWSSQPLAEDQAGWDWFSLSFEGGGKLMAFRLRGAEDYTSGTWISPVGETEALADGALLFTPLEQTEVAGRELPTRWRVALPARGLDVTVEAINDAAWMGTLVPYWEGPVTVSGSHSGRGYLEMTGYE